VIGTRDIINDKKLLEEHTRFWRENDFEWDNKVTDALHEVFKYDMFRECQRGVINACLEKKDCVCIIPTGGGKSLIFQLTALLDVGVTFVIMPTISLIKDNLMHCERLGIPCCGFYGASNDDDDLYGELFRSPPLYKIVYCTPEKI
jgi:superfamily II DNA helicase RecQ